MKTINRFFKVLVSTNLITFFSLIRGLPFVYKDYKILKKQKGKDSNFVFGKFKIFTSDKSSSSGTMSGHYFHQDMLVARKIYQNNPQKHVDIGSRQDGFIAHVAVFREIELLDIRPPQSNGVKNISFKQADLTQPSFQLINYCDSISSLHAIEHFGLGRYNDPVDYFGYIKALDNINKMLQPSGIFYFSVPIGTQRIEFNAHRVFSVSYLFNLFKNRYMYDIVSFSYVDDFGILFENICLDEKSINNNYNCNWGCGIFELKKTL